MTKTLNEMWIKWQQEVLPVGCPKGQQVESRRAFFSGAMCMLMLVKHMPLSEDEDEGVAILQKWETELVAFFDRVGKGLE